MTTTTVTTLLTLPPDLVARDRVRRQALRAGAVRHEGLAPLREAAFAGEGLALTWEVPADSEPLAVSEGALAALAPIAAGLALLHDAGVAHGGVTGAAVHVHEGRGVLSGWRPDGTPSVDVARFIALLDTFLPPASVGAEIAQLMVAGADPDPAVRPPMARIAAALERAAATAAYPISPPAHRRSRLTETPPPRPAESVDAGASPSPAPAAAAASRRSPRAGTGGPGRHAAPAGALAMSRGGIRVPWRWGVALAGTACAAFVGLSSLGSAGSAEQVCPAPADTSVWGSLAEDALRG